MASSCHQQDMAVGFELAPTEVITMAIAFIDIPSEQEARVAHQSKSPQLAELSYLRFKFVLHQ